VVGSKKSEHWWRVKFFDLEKCRHAGAADAGAVAKIFRHARKQFGGHFCMCAPARTLVGGNGAKLAIIRVAAEWTLRRINYFGRRKIHLFQIIK
jgi:hypothetical protein